MIFITYDPSASYPQPALFGLGVETDGIHVPPAGLDSFGVDEATLIHGIDERFYTVTAVDTLEAKPQSEVDAIVEQDQLPAAKEAKQAAIDLNFEAAEDVPVNIGGIDFDAGIDALTEMMSVNVAVLQGYTLPAGFTWIDTSGTEQPATETNMQALFIAVSKKHYQDAHNYSRLTKQVNAATTLAEVSAIPDW